MAKPGEMVHFFRDPLMREGDEGFGILLQKKDENSYFEFWLVKMPDTGEESVKRLAKFDFGW